MKAWRDLQSHRLLEAIKGLSHDWAIAQCPGFFLGHMEKDGSNIVRWGTRRKNKSTGKRW